jgi:hypothetical protein
LNFNAYAVQNLGSMLTGSDADVYKAFADGVTASKIFGTTQADKNLLGSEVSNVLSALTQVGGHFGARLLEAIANDVILPIPEGINGTLTATNNGLSGSRRIAYYAYTIDQVIDVCEGKGPAQSCNVRVQMDIELESASGGPKGDPVNFAITVPVAKLKVTKLLASNTYVAVEAQPSASAITADITGEVAMEDDKMLGAYIEILDFTSDLKLSIRDLQSNAVVSADLAGGFDELIVDLDMQADDLTVEVVAVTALNLNAGLNVANAAGDKLTASATLNADIVGNGAPFTYVFGEKIEKIGETASTYLGLDAVAAYSAVVGGNTLFSTAVEAGRVGNETLQLKDFSVQYGGRTYKITGEINEDGGAIKSLDTTDPVSGVRIQISTNAQGVTSGTVSVGGTQLGTIAKSGDKLIITYTDSTTQTL